MAVLQAPVKVHVPQASSNPSWDFLLSEAWCWPSAKGLYSHPIPFHFIPALGRGKCFWVDWQSLFYIHIYVVWFSKNLHNCMFELMKKKVSTGVLCTFGTVLQHICTGRGWCRNSRGAERWRVHRCYVLGLGVMPVGLGAWGLWPWVSWQWQWNSSLAVRMSAIVLQVLIVSDCGHHCY